MDFVKSIAKAIAATVAAYVVAQLARKGVGVDAVTQTSLETVLSAVVVGLVTWVVPNKARN